MMQPAGSDFALFKHVLHLLVICLSDLSAGTMQLSDVAGINRQPSFKEFTQFLETMEVYGTGYSEDVDYFKYNIRNTETHTQAMIKQLERVIQCYNLAITSLDKQRDSVLDQMPTYKHHFMCLLSFQRAIFQKLMNIQKKKTENLDNDYLIKPEGHLVLVTCGHRG
jgi:hypothetical protein